MSKTQSMTSSYFKSLCYYFWTGTRHCWTSLSSCHFPPPEFIIKYKGFAWLLWFLLFGKFHLSTFFSLIPWNGSSHVTRLTSPYPLHTSYTSSPLLLITLLETFFPPSLYVDLIYSSESICQSIFSTESSGFPNQLCPSQFLLAYSWRTVVPYRIVSYVQLCHMSYILLYL